MKSDLPFVCITASRNLIPPKENGDSDDEDVVHQGFDRRDDLKTIHILRYGNNRHCQYIYARKLNENRDVISAEGPMYQYEKCNT